MQNLWQNRAEYRDTFNFYDSVDGERRMTLQKEFRYRPQLHGCVCAKPI